MHPVHRDEQHVLDAGGLLPAADPWSTAGLVALDADLAQRGHLLTAGLRAALARLTPAPSIPLAELLTLEIPRLPRSLVMMIVTPDASPALGAALEGLRRSGIEAGVVWIRPRGEEDREEDRDDEPAAGLPEEVPVWAVRGDADLERLGSARL